MKVGIIGIGNMGSIIADSLIKNNYNVILSNRGRYISNFSNEKVEITNNIEVAKKSDYIILSVKPAVISEVIKEIKDYIKDQVIISIAAGITLDYLKENLGEKKFAIAMPNTPAKVREGMSAISPNKNLKENEVENILKIFSSFGKAEIIDEKYFNIFSSVSGCLPAYVYMFIEAVSDAAVFCGMNRNDSYKFIAQSILGSAKMVLDTKEHPGKLKDMVTSPSGTTIEGLKILEDNGFRGTIIDAIIASFNKAKEM
ncbi:MAG: pyrroline-5-carboxylate reductase [Peptoniphilaceae bacterium]|nr:pyrroline-5-carboxylate reductase [Peptoniphilaceae bacterium]MDD7383680.1 pyrroline-5-carboxylate reductase [Peptoniphilaceae bacterium]MDY3738777.1 pyrroline-5-carboxylate reductase [Peptoniphilaceae bacterium]